MGLFTAANTTFAHKGGAHVKATAVAGSASIKIKALGLLLPFLLTPPSARAVASHAFNSDGTFKIAGGLFLAPLGDGYTMTVETPSFYSYSLHEGEQNDKLSVYLDYSNLRLRKLALAPLMMPSSDVPENELKPVGAGLIENHLLSFGFLRRTLHRDTFASFAKIGALVIRPSKQLSSTREDWGLKVGFGGEFTYRYRSSFIDPKLLQQGATFIEVAYHATSLEADYLRTSPRLMEGVILTLGFRAFY